ncbi:MAG: cation-translocating P-type ATPase [Candidatus Schekmanbacteria bacterium]|nr:cation-translocating P-type ATPase [Candidatus Schekmanbacteria bacterium]
MAKALPKTHFDIESITGLSEKEAADRLKSEGYNELPSSKKRSIFSIAYDVVKEPMFLLLIAGGGIYLFLGDVQEALMLLGFVFIVMGITLYQERKTERALEALRDLASPRALVIRDGSQRRIPGRAVVCGDIMILSEGDRVPADAVLLSCLNLSVDESLLTGESVPVRKSATGEISEMSRPGGDDLPFVFSSTLVVQGFGIAETRKTGINTEIGKIGTALKTIEEEETLLQIETGKIVRNLAILGLSLCVIIIVAYGLTRGNWLNGFLAGITLAMAMLPEEFPVVLTIFLAVGAWRISQKRVLTRRVPAVETLGSASVLCVDKTGTLTMNQMAVKKICTDGTFFDITDSKEILPDNLHETVEFSILASQTDPFDPMEKALRSLGERTLSNTEHLHYDWTLIEEYPLSPHLLAMSRVWKSPENDSYIIASKGSPEAIADICHLDEKTRQSISEKINIMARDGLRVIGVAKSAFSKKSLPEGQHDFTFNFIGLIGLADPVRPSVSCAIKECYTAGIRVVMITGDYPVTAQNIASEIGLSNCKDVITGPELEKMDMKELQERIKSVNIFARVVPEQKLLIVNALKANGKIVAMTGDGVNDAAALKASHIGIAMGGRGTDVAREASAIVLLDDDFSSIVQAVRMGRRIFDNLKKAMAYIFAVHVPIAGMSLFPVLFNWPLVLLPVHIVFLELIIDPACSVVFEAEAEETDIMGRPPRKLGVPLFDRKMITYSILQGAIVLMVVMAVYVIALYRGQGELDARTLCFTTLIVANIGLILTNRSWSRSILSTFRNPNSALWWVLGGAILFLGIVLYVPFFKELFRFSTLHGIDIIICVSAGIMSILWFEVLKAFRSSSRVYPT